MTFLMKRVALSLLALVFTNSCATPLPTSPGRKAQEPVVEVSEPTVAVESEEPARAIELPSVEAPAKSIEPEPVDILAGIVIAPESHADSYDRRKQWGDWIDADGDCQNTRAEVLIAESTQEPEWKNSRSCAVVRGRWACPFTGKVFEVANALDIDHLVPLHNAHLSGAWAWTNEQRRAYANDLDFADHLVAVERRANRQKGDRGPEAWLPSENVCWYVRTWTTIKREWKLTMTQAEAAAVVDVEKKCDR